MAALTLVMLASGILISRYFDRNWWPPDDGNYAYVAQRLLAGETLQAQVHDPHAGYVNLLHESALALFGVRLVSLRYPLAILGVVQAGLVFLLLRGRGIVVGIVGALTLTALSFVQVTTPTANWYCQFTAICTICWLAWSPPGTPYRHVGTGFLVGVTFLFRQLSGVLLAIAVVTFILLEPTREQQTGSRWLARTLIVVMGCGLAGYLAKATDPVGWLLFGVWPFVLLGLAWRRTVAATGPLATAIGHLLLGAVVASLPLVGYHLVHHSIGPWLRDTTIGATEITRLEFMGLPGYTMTAMLGWRGLVHGDTAERLNGVFWLALLIAAGLAAMFTWRELARRDRPAAIHPLPVIALVYALVSVHYQVTLYLFYSAGLSLVAVLWLASQRGAIPRVGTAGAVALLAAIGLYYQAGMPLSRGLRGTIAGTRMPVNTLLDLPRGGIYVEAEDARRYERVVSLIHREAAPGQTIFAFPDNAELYFLADRPSPFRFFNTALGIRSARDLDSVLTVLRCTPPKLVFYDPDDKYNTDASRRIAAEMVATYDSLPPLPPFKVYRPRTPAACRARGGA